MYKDFLQFKAYYIIFLAIFFIENRIKTVDLKGSYAAEVAYDGILQDKLYDFCLHVLHMQTGDEWSSLLSQVKAIYPAQPTSEDFYKQLKSCYQHVQPSLYSYYLYSSLKYQQQLLGDQVQIMIPHDKLLNGYLEIGTPCRYVDYINQHGNICGIRYSIYDDSGMADILESGTLHVTRGFVPYDRMISLQDYDPISVHNIPDSTVDLVVCFIGLHHIPSDKINDFIASIYRVLSPGGLFIVRDHDACNENIFKLASAAHTVFNAIIAQSSEEEEAEEIRNFRPLTYWIELLEQHGFVVGQERILQHGDPTLNTLLKFTKPVTEQDSFINKLYQKTGYIRQPHQTFLTAPEWFNVDCAKAYGDFLNHTPWYEFPYWQSTKTYWSIFGHSYEKARSVSSLYDILIKSDYFWTCIFIGVFMTAEYGVKSIVATPFSLLMNDSFDHTIDILVQGFPQENLKNLPSKVVVKEEFNDFLVLEIPRYDDFQMTMKKLADSSCSLIEVGGQRIIQVKVRWKEQDNRSSSIRSSLETWTQLHGAQLAYSWTTPTVSYVYASIVVPVSKIQQMFHDALLYDYQIVYVHDF